MEQGQIFDVKKVRAWLAASKNSASIPSIEALDGLLLP
jgi:hypothetical protein